MVMTRTRWGFALFETSTSLWSRLFPPAPSLPLSDGGSAGPGAGTLQNNRRISVPPQVSSRTGGDGALFSTTDILKGRGNRGSLYNLGRFGLLLRFGRLFRGLPGSGLFWSCGPRLTSGYRFLHPVVISAAAPPEGLLLARLTGWRFRIDFLLFLSATAFRRFRGVRGKRPAAPGIDCGGGGL